MNNEQFILESVIITSPNLEFEKEESKIYVSPDKVKFNIIVCLFKHLPMELFLRFILFNSN